MPEPLAPREAAARKLLTLAVLKKMLAEDDAKARKDDGAAFNRAGQAETVDLPDGTPLGRVRTDKGTPGGWKVTDAAQLLAWTQEHAPGAVVEKTVTTYEVDAAYVEELVEQAGNPSIYDPSTGELLDGVPPGITYAQPGPPKLVVTADPKAIPVVRAALGQTLTQLGLEA